MVYKDLLDLIESDEVLKEMATNICLTDISGRDISSAYYWVKSRIGKCTCSYTIDEMKNAKYVTAFRVLTIHGVSADYDYNIVNQECLDMLAEMGMLSTKW